MIFTKSKNLGIFNFHCFWSSVGVRMAEGSTLRWYPAATKPWCMTSCTSGRQSPNSRNDAKGNVCCIHISIFRIISMYFEMYIYVNIYIYIRGTTIEFLLGIKLISSGCHWSCRDQHENLSGAAELCWSSWSIIQKTSKCVFSSKLLAGSQHWDWTTCWDAGSRPGRSWVPSSRRQRIRPWWRSPCSQPWRPRELVICASNS